MKNKFDFSAVGLILFVFGPIVSLPLILWSLSTGSFIAFVIALLLFVPCLVILIQDEIKSNTPEAKKARMDAEKRRAQLTAELKQCASFSEDSTERDVLIVKKLHPRFASAFSVEKIMVTPMTYNPEKYVYTSATVGGITTGGIHKVGGDYTKGKKVDSEKCRLKYFGQEVKIIRLTDELLKKAKKTAIKKYLDDKKQITVVSEINPGAAVVAAQIAGTYSMATQLALCAGYPSCEKCQEIIDWLCDADSDSNSEGEQVSE